MEITSFEELCTPARGHILVGIPSPFVTLAVFGDYSLDPLFCLMVSKLVYTLNILSHLLSGMLI